MARRGFVLVLLGLLVGITACQGKVSTKEPTATSLVTATQIAQQPTETPLLPTHTVTEALSATLPSSTLTRTPTLIPPSNTPTSSPIATASVTPSPTDTELPTATATATINITQTAEAMQVQHTQVAQAVMGTLAAWPTYTPYPTFTVMPSITPSLTSTPSKTFTPSPTYTATPTGSPTPNWTATARIYLSQTSAANEFLTATQQAAAYTATAARATSAAGTQHAISTQIEQDVAATLTAQPTITATPFNTATAQAQQGATETAQAFFVTQTPYPTYTLYPTYTPYPTLVPATVVITSPPVMMFPSPTGPTPDLFATATAMSQSISPTPVGTLEPIDYVYTTIGDLGLEFDYPAGWEALSQLEEEFAFIGLSPDYAAFLVFLRATPQAFVEADYFNSTDPKEALRELGLSAEVRASDRFEDPAWEALFEAPEDNVTVHYYLIEHENEWVIIIGVAASEQFDMFDQTILNQVVDTLAILPTSTLLALTSTPILIGPTITPTLTWSQATATKLIADATQTVSARLTPTVSPSGTLSPFSLTATQMALEYMPTLPPFPTYTATATPSPTIAPSPTINFGPTATQAVLNATATAAALSTPSTDFDDGAFGVWFKVPSGWSTPRRINENVLLLSDNTASVYIYRGDGQYFEQYWGIPADETSLNRAAIALSVYLEGVIAQSDIEGAALVIPSVRGALYLFSAPDGEWLIASLSAPETEFERYHQEVFAPLLHALEVSERIQEVVPTPTVTMTPYPSATPSPIATLSVSTRLERYTDETMGLSFDAPADWFQSSLDDLYISEFGITNVIFSVSDEDVNLEVEPTAPIFMVIRFDGTALEPMGFETIPPDELLSQMGLGVQAELYDLARYPAARGLTTEEDSTGVIYALLLPDDALVMIILLAPPGYNAEYLDEVITQPVVRSLDVLAVEPTPTPLPTSTTTPTLTVTPTAIPTLPPTYTAVPTLPITQTARATLLPTWTPMPTYTPTATATPLDVSNIELEPYISDDLGLSFDSPVEWIPVVSEDEDFPAVLFFSNPADAQDEGRDDPTSPALGVARLSGDEFVEGVLTPEEFLREAMGLDASSVIAFPGLDYPAARGVVEDDYSYPSVVYAIQLAATDWILVVLVAPGMEQRLPLLDEVVAQPVVRSMKVEVDKPTPEITPSPTDTPQP